MTEPTKKPIDWDADVVVGPTETYDALVRSIARTDGFGMFFVRCVEGDQADLVARLRSDLPKLKLERLQLEAELVDGNLYRRVKEIIDRTPVDVLCISGLEKSLDPYVKSGYGGVGDYYNKDMVPRILGHLNLQRERFRDDFPFCFIFFLSAFGIKFIARRSPDFFDWRSGIFEFVPDEETVRTLTKKMHGDYNEYLTWNKEKRIDRIREIQALIDEEKQSLNGQVRLLYERSIILISNENWKEAVISLDRGIEIKSDAYPLWYIRGMSISMADSAQKEEAIESYDKVIELKPDYYEAWYERGRCLFVLDRKEEAIVSYDKVIELKPDHYEAWYQRGNTLFVLDRKEEAIESYDKVIELKPDHYEAWYQRGNTLFVLDRKEEAIDSCEKVIQFKPDYYEAWYIRGSCLHTLGQKESAIESYDKAIELKPDHYEAWYQRGNALFLLGRKEEAMTSYNKVIEFKSDDYEAWYLRGLCLTILGQKEEAVASCDKAIEVKSDYYDAWYLRGVCLRSLYRKEDAINSYEKAIEFKPDHYEAWYNRGISLDALGRKKRRSRPTTKRSNLNLITIRLGI